MTDIITTSTDLGVIYIGTLLSLGGGSCLSGWAISTNESIEAFRRPYSAEQWRWQSLPSTYAYTLAALKTISTEIAQNLLTYRKRHKLPLYDVDIHEHNSDDTLLHIPCGTNVPIVWVR